MVEVYEVAQLGRYGACEVVVVEVEAFEGGEVAEEGGYGAVEVLVCQVYVPDPFWASVYSESVPLGYGQVLGPVEGGGAGEGVLGGKEVVAVFYEALVRAGADDGRDPRRTSPSSPPAVPPRGGMPPAPRLLPSPWVPGAGGR